MGENFAALLDAVARRRPDAAAILCDDESLSWREVELRAGGVARRLSRHGVRAGDTVALQLPNGWGFVAALWGALKLGATVSPINPLLSAEERRKVLGHLEPALVVEEVREEEAVWDSVGATGPALVLYTSGSTGEPKGAVLSHTALRAANESWAGPVMGLVSDDIVLAALPMAHSFGLNGGLLAPLLAGATVAVLERFTPDAALGVISRHRVTVFPAVATMFQRILEVPGLSCDDLASLRVALSGAAPCPWELARAWKELTGVRILRGYGMTELFRPISYLADDLTDLPDSIGRAVPGVELRIMSEERALGAGEIGELWIRSPAALEGYLRAPEETRAVIEEGWFRTGDLATISADGFVTIVGRKKELILRGGYSVVPGEVEAALLGHPAVAEAAVIGMAHAELGEEIVAFVALRPGAQITPEDLVAFCRQRLASFKCPRQVSIVAGLPKSATGKVLKSRLPSGRNYIPDA